MKAYRLAAAGLALGLLTGCASLLERSYTTSEPHSSKFCVLTDEDQQIVDHILQSMKDWRIMPGC